MCRFLYLVIGSQQRSCFDLRIWRKLRTIKKCMFGKSSDVFQEVWVNIHKSKKGEFWLTQKHTSNLVYEVNEGRDCRICFYMWETQRMIVNRNRKWIVDEDGDQKDRTEFMCDGKIFSFLYRSRNLRHNNYSNPTVKNNKSNRTAIKKNVSAADKRFRLGRRFVLPFYVSDKKSKQVWIWRWILL